ncbi:MAG: GlsB/YeaQ/YmgE family stress response membrane protein [Bryobacteraceae bacterium]
MFGVLGWFVLGFVLGLIARMVLRARDPDGALLTILIGIAGALLGGVLGLAMGVFELGQPVGVVGALIGSVMLLLVKGLTVVYENRSGR